MFKKALIVAVLIGIALVSNGAQPASAVAVWSQELRPVPSIPAVVDSTGIGDENSDELKEEFHQTYPLSATGRVGLENINGSVQVKVWDQSSVRLDAVKHAYRKERLAEAKIKVNASDDNIHIKTEYPDSSLTFRDGSDRYDNPAAVDYTLTVPRTAILDSIEVVNGTVDIDGVEGSVKASSINGRVIARSLRGDVKLTTINGPLEATFAQLNDANPIALSSVNGSVTLIIPSDSSASVRAGTVHGGISNDFGMRVKHGEYIGHSLDGQIGNGGPRIKLGNVNGPIKINHAQDGRAVSPATSLASGSDGDDEDSSEMDSKIGRDVARATSAASIEATAAIRVNAAKIARDAQREVDVALRDAQREVERAQVEVQRENAKQIREQVRIARAGRGAGAGAGAGAGSGVRWGRAVSNQESKSFSVNGSPSVNVVTFDGPITVHGWDKAEVMYTVTKTASDDETLKQIDIQTEQNGSSVSVVAKGEHDRNGSTQFEVWVPRKASLHVSSDDGALNLDGVSGDITLRTGDGSIDVSDGGGVLQLNTGDGHIEVKKFDGQLDARTGDGAISLDGSFNALSARTGDGGITLTVPANSNFTVETNGDNDVSNEGRLNISEDIAPSRRVKRWRVGNGGKVFVLNTGDGAIVLRSK